MKYYGIQEKWIGWSRRFWGNVLAYGGAALLVLQLATPELVSLVMAPFVELASALGWEIDPSRQERARRAALALAAIVGLFAKLRSRINPDHKQLTFVPNIPTSVGEAIGSPPGKG